MLDLATDYRSVWPADLEPIGYDTDNLESFGDWWERHQPRLEHLHPQICEQWVHRHFATAFCRFLPLEALKWRMEVLPTGELLKSVCPEFAKRFDPEIDYAQLHGDLAFTKCATAEALDNGTWDYPIIALETPEGVVSSAGERPDVRLVLIEGHSRYKYLNALSALGKPVNDCHEFFVLEIAKPFRPTPF